MAFTIWAQFPPSLEAVGGGASGQVYKIDEHVVLKALTVYDPPASDASPRDQWYYASETLFASSLMKDERTVFRLLEQWPHPNIVEVIDIDQAEGIYLRKYLPLSKLKTPSQADRISWYQDIIRGLLHLHDLRIAHADVRIDNLLFGAQDQALLCDFSASCPFGYPNLAYPREGLPIPINGPVKTLSDSTDRFAMASLMFQVETGTKPDLSLDDTGMLVLPQIHVGHSGIESIIRRAWLKQFSSTAQMLDHAESLYNRGSQETHSPRIQSLSKDALRDRIRQWRKDREKQYNYVLYALPTEDQLQNLADLYGLELNGEERFSDYKAPDDMAEAV
ncbi:MAG: hypothetical protein M1837_001052 [Sclerophora amabilis]|nr:MAG: hypothetical protein M1837_001052 [Sclerophora amabilis]